MKQFVTVLAISDPAKSLSNQNTFAYQWKSFVLEQYEPVMNVKD